MPLPLEEEITIEYLILCKFDPKASVQNEIMDIFTGKSLSEVYVHENYKSQAQNMLCT